MNSHVHLLIEIFMYAFILSTLFGAGLSLGIWDIIEPIKNARSVIKILLANYIVIPLIAFVLSVLLNADPGLRTGLMIISCCAGADFIPKLIMIARGSIGHAVGFMFLLMVATSILAPIILPLAVPGISVDPVAIAKPLVVMMLLPLVLGLIIKTIKPKFADMLEPQMKKVSSVSIIVTGVLFLSVQYNLFISAYGTGVFNLTGLYTIAALVLGFIIGGKKRNDRIIFTIGCGARNMAAGILIASASFPDPRVLTTILIGALMQFSLLFLTAFLFGRQKLETA
jgi:BASS family bile acid:Na+ symporter